MICYRYLKDVLADGDLVLTMGAGDIGAVRYRPAEVAARPAEVEGALMMVWPATVQFRSGELRHDEPMSKHTSWRVGGKRRNEFFVPADLEDLQSFLARLDAGTPVFWHGVGSNLLVRDGGMRGVVISATGILKNLEQTDHYCRAGRRRRALHAAGAPVHSLGPRALRILRRDSRHRGWRAGHECRRPWRRNLGACRVGAGRSIVPARFICVRRRNTPSATEA